MKEELKDIQKFAIAVHKYFSSIEKCVEENQKELFLTLQLEIKDLLCEDFRIYYFRAFYQNSTEQLDDARNNIDKSMKLLLSVKKSSGFDEENGTMLLAPIYKDDGYICVKEMNYNHSLIGKIYSLAGEIYAKIGKLTESINYYKKSQYHHSFLRSDFERIDSVHVFSFRRYNQFTLADLINNEITVSPSTCMNDPFDSIINLWGDEKKLSQTCTEKLHIKPMHDAFGFYRIRSFCMGRGNTPIKNILLWSHYADEHRGFCVKYKLSQHFIKQKENENGQHMYLKKIDYKNLSINLYSKSIDSNLALATKKKVWKYENEVRLIVYDTKKEDAHYAIPLDEDSEIEAIYFGYLSPKSTIKTIQNIFAKRGTKPPKFFKMTLNPQDVYNLRIEKCPYQ